MNKETETRNENIVSRLSGLAGCTPDKIRHYAALGLFDIANLTDDDVTGIRLIQCFEESGFPVEHLAALFKNENVSLDFAREMLALPARISGQTYGEVIEELGFSPGFAAHIAIALGVPKPAPDQLAREDDVAFLKLNARALQAGISKNALLRYLRAFGRALRTISEAQRDLFRSEVIQPMLDSEIPLGTYLTETARKRYMLQKMGFEATVSTLARYLEQIVFEDITARLHEELRKAGMPAASGKQARVVCFMDVSGYTDIVQQHGDFEGVAIAATLEQIVQRWLDPEHGRIIKTLGDGLLIVFDDPNFAVDAALQILSEVATGHEWSLHVGMATGRVIFRDGDVYGATVNRAARICSQAKRGSIFIDQALYRQIDSDARSIWNRVELAPMHGLSELFAYEARPRA